jgi:hypothetical protein
VPVDQGPPPYDVLAVLVVSLRGERAEAQGALSEALAELFGVPVSSGTVAAITSRAAGDLGGFTERVRDEIAGSVPAMNQNMSRDEALSLASKIEDKLWDAGFELVADNAEIREVIERGVAEDFGIDPDTHELSEISDWIESAARDGIVNALMHQQVSELPEKEPVAA